MAAASCLRLLLASLVFWGDFSSKGQIVVDDFESTAMIPENSPPGTRISEFQIIVYNFPILQITITSVPKSKFFQIRWRKTDEINSRNIFRAEIFLNNYVSLDHEKTPTYLLTISISAENTDTQTKQLWLYVLDVWCGVQFQTPGGATVRVLETAEPLSQIYTIVSAPTFSGNFTYTITETVPESARDYFSVDRSGTIHVPLNGFGRYNEKRNFILHIRVTANLKTICTGSVTILVIPDPWQTPVFTSVPQTISIPENQGPEFYVTTVSATGDRVRYHLATFNPSFQIGEETGIIKTSCNLDLDQERGLAVNLLVIIAHDGSYRYSSSANVTVHVTDVNDNDPLCMSAIFVAEILETTPVGSTLFELSCSDPDYTHTNLSYTIISNNISQFKFKYEDHSIKEDEDGANLACLAI